MSVLVWDDIGEKKYETGVDRGVLYLPNGLAVPWNGLTSVIEKFDKESSPVYYDGMKINDLVTLGNFSGTMRAITYPDEFMELEGHYKIKRGVWAGDQKVKSFGLCYRTKLGNDLNQDAGYKIHILYNVTAFPSDKEYSTIAESLTLTEFEWEITAVPEEVLGFRPTAHIILDSSLLKPALLEELEAILYGSESSDASLMPYAEFVEFLDEWAQLDITDNGDGTWSASTEIAGYISMLSSYVFQIDNADVEFIDADTYTITDT